MARVLVVEDDGAIGELVGLYLKKEGHEVELIGNGLAAWERFEKEPNRFDLVVLDLMLPGLDGRGVCRRMRAVSDAPVIMLTALDDDRDKIEGLDLGADDYLTKPFNPNELVARVRAILRRSERSERAERAAPSPGATARVIEVGNTRIDLDGRLVAVEGVDTPLRTKEFDLLVALTERTGVVLTRDRLLERVWGGEYEGDTRTVDVHVSRLRERLATAGATIAIETVRSVGYRVPRRGGGEARRRGLTADG